ncbi:MAG: aromatic ring-hydroxylating dioxygenase subunit alpha [Saprospiraceae bacterium]|nr:aromatic ring-hydroxylating dioxygenase subunit alpha [Saprospiraceae bacterium]
MKDKRLPPYDFEVHANIAEAKTIHTAVYHDANVFQVLLEKIFVPSWQFIASCDELPTEDFYFPFSFLPPIIDEPLVAVKNSQGQFDCFSNVCTHRGNILATEACTSKHGLICKYHGRRFSADGKMVFMPEFKEVQNFPSAQDDLPRYPIQKWGNWLFTSLDQDSSLSPAYAHMMERLSFLTFDIFRYDASRDSSFTIHANWALYCENYLEGFHIPFVHAGLNQVLDFGSYETLTHDDCILQIGYAKEGELCFDLPADHPDYGKNVAAYYYFVFPNLMFNFYPWGLSLNIVAPLSVDQTVVTFKTYILDDNKYNQGAGSDLHTVEMEDEAIVEWVQKGTKSRAYTHGRYSAVRETGPHHFHRLLAMALND